MLPAAIAWGFYLLPRMEAGFNSFRDEAYFAVLDAHKEGLKSTFEEQDWKIAPFCSHHGLYYFTQLLFAIQNCPSNFTENNARLNFPFCASNVFFYTS